jgi:SAM-dependent methyltransferase
MQDLERRLGAEALRGQLRDARPSAADPLTLPPEQRAGVTPDVWAERAAEYLPFLREGAARAAGAGQIDVLEFGCGDGAVAAAAASAGLSVCGVDPREEHVAHCAARMVPALQAGLREHLLHAPEHEYRCVVLLHVLQYCPLQHVPALLQELKRVLAPGGRLLIEIPNADNPLLAGRGPAPSAIMTMLAGAGFGGVFAHPLHPAPRRGTATASLDPALPGAGPVNAALERIDALLYGPHDVLIIAERD